MSLEFVKFLEQGQVEKSPFVTWLKEEEKKTPFQRYIATQQELRETEKSLLAKAQEKVRYKFTPGDIEARKQADSPTKWSDETWSAVGETMKELPAAQLFTKEFWSETGKKFISDAYDLIKEETGGRQMRWIKRTGQVLGKYTYLGAVFPPLRDMGDTAPVKEAGTEIGKTAVEFVLFIPKTAFNFARDPINAIKESPLDVLMLVGAVAGAKVVKGIKAKAKKGWVKTGDIIDPILESKVVDKNLKKRLLEVPSDIELELFPEQIEVKLPIKKMKPGEIIESTLEAIKQGKVLRGQLKAGQKVIIEKPIEIIKYKEGGKMPFYKHWWEGIKRDMSNAGDLPDRPTKFGTKKYPWLGSRIPLRTFEQYPWLKRVLYDEWRAGEYNALLESAVLKNELKVWKKRLPRKSQERVGIHADYMQEAGAEIMEFMGKAQPELTALEMQYYNWGQKVFRDFLPRLNQIRTLAGQKKIGKVQNYSTWVRNLSELESLGIDILHSTAQEIEFHLNSLPLSMAKHRAKGIIRAGVELDYGLLLENYARQATRNIHVSPAIIKSRTLLEPFRTGKGNQITWDMFKESPKLATWLEQWTDRIAGQGKAIPTGKFGKVIKTMNALNKNIAIAILSFNVRSAIIQPSAFKNSYVYLGRKYLVEGFKQNLSPEKRAFADATSQHLLARKKGLHDVTVAMTREVPVGKKLGVAKHALGQAGMFPLQWLDYQTARSTWLGAYEMARKKFKYGFRRAVTHADDVVVKTQASAQIGDIAPIQGTPMGKFMTLFQTFVINDYDMLTHDVFGYKNPYVNMAQRQRNIGRYVLATAVTNAVYEGILKIRSPYPAPIWSIKRSVEEGDSFLQATLGVAKELAEVYPVWGGTARWSTPYRIAFPAFMQSAIVDPYQIFERLVAKPSLTRDQLEWMGKMLGVPGTSQVMKYLRRRKRGQTHEQAILGVRSETKKKKQPSW